MQSKPSQQIELVKQVIDLKGPLKGKGATLAQWRDAVQERMAQTRGAMQALSLETKAIEGRRFALMVYSLRGQAQQLRWRMTNSQHATWARIQPLLDTLPPGLARYYVQAEELAQILNHQEQAERYEIKTVVRLTDGRKRSAVAYTSTVGQGIGGGRPRRLAIDDMVTHV